MCKRRRFEQKKNQLDVNLAKVCLTYSQKKANVSDVRSSCRFVWFGKEWPKKLYKLYMFWITFYYSERILRVFSQICDSGVEEVHSEILFIVYMNRRINEENDTRPILRTKM